MVAQLVKGLKPRKLAIDKVRLNILNELRAEGNVIKKEFEKTTATWKGAKPTFEIAIGLTGQDATVLIGPAGDTEGAQKWVWANDGTRKRDIVPKNGPYLTFRVDFTPKTTVRSFSSGSGSIKPPWVRVKRVKGHEIKARGWTIEIVKRRRKPFTQRILKAARI